jgi:PAS domain S-box-containing protein
MFLTKQTQKPMTVFWQYAVAIINVLIAVALKFLFPGFFRGVPYFLFWPAVIISAWYGGFGPGMVASLLSSFVIVFVILPITPLTADLSLYLLQTGLFILITAVIAGFYHTRKRSQEVMYQQQEWLRVTLNSIGDGVIATDVDGKVVFINPIAATLTGWSQAEALRQPIEAVFNILNETTREPVPIPLIEALKKGSIVGLANHTVLISKDGTERPIMDSGAPIRDQEGEIMGAVLVFRDATDRRDAARVQETLELVMSGIDEGFVIFDNNWRYTYANRRAGEMGMDARGRSHEDLLKMTLEESFPELVGTRLYQQLKDSSVDKISRQFEEYIEPYDHWYEYRVYPTQSGLGIFVIDISDQKKIEQKIELLQQLTASLNTALTAAEMAKIIADQGFGLLGAHMGSINLLRDDNSFEIIGARGVPKEMLLPQPVKFTLKDNVPLADSVRNRKPIFIETVEEYKQQYPQVYETFHFLSHTEAMVALPMIVEEEVIGGIAMSFPKPLKMSEEEREFMLTLAQQAAQALKRALLSERAQELIAVQERQRLAQDLHDSVSQALFSATTIAQAIPMTWNRNQELAMEQLQKVIQINRAAMSEMRILLLELRPQAIIKTSLSELLKHMIDASKGRKMIETELAFEGEEFALPDDVHVAVYRIVQESVNNILKHSQASRFTIRARYLKDQFIVEVQDNGKGFDPTQVIQGMGLSNLQERADDINARLEIITAPDDGTLIRATWDRQSAPAVSATP